MKKILKKIILTVVFTLSLQVVGVGNIGASTQTGNTYTVQKGDSLWEISREYKVSVNQLKLWNHLKNNIIRVGQKLVVKQNQKTDQTTSNYEVKASYLNVRQAASNTSKILETIKKSTVVVSTGSVGDWKKIKYGNAQAYVNGKYLVPTNKPVVIYQPLKGKIIVLDAGHGGKDPGAIKNGAYEKNINLAVTLKTKFELEKLGATVYATRTNDSTVEYDERTNLSKEKKAHIFISIHSNSANSSSLHGTETFYNAKVWEDGKVNPFPTESKELATEIHQELVPALGTKNLGIDQAAFIVLRKNHVPSALIELAFLSNTSDASKLKNNTYQQKAAEAIAKGVIDYFN